jgi:hypothetical protein
MKKETANYLLAERMIRDAIMKGSQLINIRCLPKERFFADTSDYFDMVEEGNNSSIKLRNRDWVLGIFMREKGRDSPYISLQPSLLLPLLTTFSEKMVWKGRQGFAMYNENSRKTLEKFIDVTLYLERDFSISIEFEEFKS